MEKVIFFSIVSLIAGGSVIYTLIATRDEGVTNHIYDVTTYNVAQGVKHDVHIFGARVASSEEAVIAAQVSGAIHNITINEGERVKKGQIIGHIDAGEYAAQYAQSQQILAIAEEQEKLARRKWDDLKPEERTQYTLESEKMRAVVAESAAYVKKSYVRAPFDGIVSSKFVSEGTTVMSGTPIVRIIGNMERKEVVFDVPIDVGRTMTVGTTVDVVYGEDTTHAIVYAIDPVADEQTRKITVHATLSDPSQIIIGTFVDVHVRVEMNDEGFAVPYASIVRRYDDMFVHVVVGDTVQTRSIDIVATTRDHVVIRGVAVGDEIVVHNAHGIDDGDRIRSIGADQ